MSNRSDRERRFAQAETALAGYFARLEAGEGLSFEGWAADQPEIAHELHELYAVCGILREPRIGQGAGAPSPALAALGRAPNRFGEYVIDPTPLAQGGMGTIFSAQDRALERELVLKILRRGSGSLVEGRRVARFLTEARVTSQLAHPGIVPVYEVGLDAEGRPYIAMKRVEGRTLASAFDSVAAGDPVWTQARALAVLQRVCEAVSFAHARGVIHRDLKPDNVMVGEFGEVYVMDWGVARVLGRKDAHDIRLKPEPGGDAADSPLVTMDGDVVGTPAYMPPEQARGEIEELTPRSDVYSIGALLYHLLARQAPYVPPAARMTSRGVLERVVAGPPVPLQSLRRELPAELVAICEQAMARDPARRYPDTLSLAEDLRAYLENRVVRAYQTGALAEFKKWVARNRGLALASGAALLVALGGLGWVSLVQTRAKREVGALALANASKAAESVDPMRALLLAREAARVQLSPAVVSQLHSALVGSLEEAVFRGHAGRVSGAVFSRSGDVLSASVDHTARIWKPDGSGFVALVGHERALCAAVFSPAGDLVLSGSEDGTARLWDLGGRELRRLEGHTDAVNALAFSPAGDRIVTGSFDGTARLWDGDGSLFALLTGHRRRLTLVAWSPSGDRIASASEDGDVRVWDARGGALALLPHCSSVSALAFSPDGRRLLTGAKDGVPRLWDLETARATELTRQRTEVASVAFSPDGQYFATGMKDGLVRLWSSDGASSVELRGHTTAVCCTTFSPDSQMLATAGSSDATARVWDLQGRSVGVLRGHAGSVVGVQFAPDFKPDRSRLLTASSDGTARTWRLKGAEIQTYRSVPWGVRALAVSGVARGRVLVAPPVGRARILDQDGNTVYEYGDPQESLHSAKFSSDAQRVVIAGDSGVVRVFELDETPVVQIPVHGPGCRADFSPDGSRILTWSDDEPAKLWDLAGHCLQAFDVHEGRVRSAAFSPKQQNQLVTGSSDCCARIFDCATGACLRTLRGHRGTVVSVAFSHAGRKVLTAGDQTARIWDLGGQDTVPLLHTSSADVAAFSADDRLVAVGCGDGSTWLWDTQTGEPPVQLPGHSAGVIAAEFEEDGTLATACADGNVRVRYTTTEQVLELVGHKITREFTHAELVQYSALLGHEYDALLGAYDCVEPLLASAPAVAKVREAVRGDPRIREDVRQAALRVLGMTYDDPEQVRLRTWAVVRQAGLSSEEYARARVWAGIADDLGHADLAVRVLLGVAQHRVGDEAAALRTLEALDPKLGESEPGPQLACSAALALVQHALGREHEARSELARLERLVTALPDSVPYAYRAIVDEARALQIRVEAGAR